MNKMKLYLTVFIIVLTSANAGMVDEFMDACEKGSMQGCYQAGVVYWTGEGAQKDRQAARSLLEISCDGGFDDACVALRTLNAEKSDVGSVKSYKPKKSRYTGHIDGKLQSDIDRDGKKETIAWKKFASVDLGDYYQLLVIDDDGSLLWEGPKEKDEGNPYIFSALDIGVSPPELLADIDNDGYMELLAPELQSDVRPVYYRKLRWRGTYFEPLLSNALMLSSRGSNRFVWKTISKSYGTWISKLAPYGNGLVKANVMAYNKDGSVSVGTALIKFDRQGAVVHRWIKPIPSVSMNKPHRKSSHVTHKKMGLVHGLDPHGDGFLSIRKKPRAKEIGRLYNGNKVEILGRSGKWYKIKDIKTGRVGWSHSHWIRIQKY